MSLGPNKQESIFDRLLLELEESSQLFYNMNFLALTARCLAQQAKIFMY